MTPNSSSRSRWLVLVLYAIAMAWVEASVVYYLRTFVDRIEPYQPHPLPIATGLAEAELLREAATLVMLAAVGWLAGSTWRSRSGYSLVAFGVWDIFYYVFLRILTGWPTSLLDWDILFLIPLPWWGPVIAPVSIAVVMIVFGAIVAGSDRTDQPLWPGKVSSIAGILGILLSLYVFMSDAIHSTDKSAIALRNLLPVQFDWPKFSFALLLLVAPLVDVAVQRLKRRAEKAPVALTPSEPAQPAL